MNLLYLYNEMKFNKRTAGVVTIAAAVVQVLIILYNHLTGYVPLGGITEFFIRVFAGTILSAPVGAALVYADLKIIHLINKRFIWQTDPITRTVSELVLSTAAGVVFGTIITITADLLFPYKDGLIKNIVTNSLIAAVINLIIIAILEALAAYKRDREARLITEELEREITKIRFEVLKNQLNPHFLFNSLNVLSSLMRKNVPAAQDFIDEFSSVYRYILEVIDKPLVELREEMEFAKSYLYLQQIRFSDAVKITIDIEGELMSSMLPPLSIQTLIENAFKHNRATTDTPLHIKIFNKASELYVTNNNQIKNVKNGPGGIGLQNLKKRYALITSIEPVFKLKENEYSAMIPLITDHNLIKT